MKLLKAIFTVKKIFSFLLFVFSVILLAGRLGLFRGKRPEHLGIKNGKLLPPRFGLFNSVSSHFDLPKNLPSEMEKYYRIDPIKLNSPPKIAFEKLKEILVGHTHAKLIEEKENYLYLEFETPVLRFIDDVEFLLSESEGIIHLRSSSRLGRKDFGKNRKRIEQIRTQFQRIESTHLIHN